MGFYKYLTLPFGINLTPEEFESKLHEKRDGLPRVKVIRDDILVMGYGENDEEATQNHDENLLRLLDRACKANLRPISSKVNHRKSEVRFMGHLITKNGLKPDPDKAKEVEEYRSLNQRRSCRVSLDSSITCQSSCLGYLKLHNH